MSIWTDIVTTAVVGTERQAFNAGAADAALQALFAQLDATDREGALLHAAALTALHERAGHLPARHSEALPEVAPEESVARCNARVAARLRLLLQGEYADLFPEFLTTLAQANQRVPEELLPMLLDYGKSREALAELLPPVIGARGLWLARQNAEWAYALGASGDLSLWETGTLPQRKALLQRVRRTDPAQARALLLQTWEQDSTKEVTEFFPILKEGLSTEDEALLEKGLDRPWTMARQAAASLLAGLPDSAFVGRMWERAQQCLTFKRNQRGKLSIEVRVPTERDGAMQRDGISKSSTARKMSEPAWWLQQIISAIPPERWETAAGASVDELLQATHKHEYQTVLLEGWQQAAMRTRNAAWLERFLPAALKENAPDQVFEQLPRERQERLALELLRESKAWKDWVMVRCVINCIPAPWSEMFSHAFIQAFCQHGALHAAGWGSWLWREILRMGCQLHPATIVPAHAALEQLAATSQLELLLNLLQFRQDMLQELASSQVGKLSSQNE